MNTQFNTFILDNKLTLDCKFVPLSKARRDTDDKHDNLSMNYIVSILRDGKKIATTPYRMGIGHCAIYKNLKDKDFNHLSESRQDAIARECETGKAYALCNNFTSVKPDIKSVLHSISMDSDADEYSFEDWCSNLDYDTDSRRAFAIYNECLKTAASIRHATGAAFLSELRVACEGF